MKKPKLKYKPTSRGHEVVFMFDGQVLNFFGHTSDEVAHKVFRFANEFINSVNLIVDSDNSSFFKLQLSCELK